LRAQIRRKSRVEEARVTTIPPAIETSSDGIIVTRPSPTVSTVISLERLAEGNIELKDAIRNPATMLIPVMRMVAIESR